MGNVADLENMYFSLTQKIFTYKMSYEKFTAKIVSGF